jgi:heme exporter protein C
MSKSIPYLLLVAAAALLPYSVQRVFLHTPIEAEMGTAQKIFYFHVPLAWICMLFAVVCGIAAGIELRKRSPRAAAIAVACGEMTVLAGVGVLITGPIWGDATWGTPWTGDARQVSTALLWLVFVAYLLVRRYGPSNSERIAAALAIFGAINVPITYKAVEIWKTTHPQTGVVGSLPAAMWIPFWYALGGLLSLSVAFVWIRAAQERTAIALDEAWIASERPQPKPA